MPCYLLVSSRFWDEGEPFFSYYAASYLVQEMSIEPLTVMKHYLEAIKAQTLGMFIPAKIPSGERGWLFALKSVTLKWKRVEKLTKDLQLLEESITNQQAALEKGSPSEMVSFVFKCLVSLLQ